MAQGRRPVILLEHADRMHDSTYVLRAVLERRLGRTAVPLGMGFQGLLRPQLLRVWVLASAFRFGGHTSDRAGGPVTVEGTLIYAGSKQYRATEPRFHGGALSISARRP